MSRSTALKLAKYQSLRDFSRTPEPRGEVARERPGHIFVVQEHAASHLHYDFRLELDGVLLSWAVPKGPSLSPSIRRLAVRTEDHPLDYANFEGVIPEGQYGAGAVLVWDRGTWQPEGDPHAGLANGRLAFTLHGQKLRGRWHLARTKSEDGGEDWVLVKDRDAEANDQIDITATEPASVLSGRTIEEIAAGPHRVFHGEGAA